MIYTPGLHILSEIYSDQSELLTDYHAIKHFLDEKITFLELTKVGEVYHNFSEGGYTGVVCLTESHLALHTWPEYKVLTLDVYLSNNKKKNDEKARQLFDKIIEFFNSTRFNKQEVFR